MPSYQLVSLFEAFMSSKIVLTRLLLWVCDADEDGDDSVLAKEPVPPAPAKPNGIPIFASSSSCIGRSCHDQAGDRDKAGDHSGNVAQVCDGKCGVGIVDEHLQVHFVHW